MGGRRATLRANNLSVPNRGPLKAPVSSFGQGDPLPRRSTKDDLWVLLLNEKATKRPIGGVLTTVIRFDTAWYVGGFELARTSGRRWELAPDGRIQMPQVWERNHKNELTRSNLLIPNAATLEAICRAIQTHWADRGQPTHPLYDPERPWPYPLPLQEPNMRAHRWDDLDIEMPAVARAQLTLDTLARAQVRFKEGDANKRREDLIRRLTSELGDADPTERVVIEDAIARLRAEMSE